MSFHLPEADGANYPAELRAAYHIAGKDYRPRSRAAQRKNINTENTEAEAQKARRRKRKAPNLPGEHNRDARGVKDRPVQMRIKRARLSFDLFISGFQAKFA